MDGRGWRVERPTRTTSSHEKGMSELRFLVPGISCRHCADAVAAEISKARGVNDVQIDVTTCWVAVQGWELDIEAVRAATDEAGHQADL